jgi:CheY-like chemotaxis protein
MPPTTILCVEDNLLIAEALKDSLEMEGWTVELCHDGTTALARINANEHYDLLLLDNDLPGMSGLELLRHARSLHHRQQTPIIIFSASNVKREAQRAGANAFLRKPEDIPAIAETITQLLTLQPELTDKGQCQ